MQTCDLPVGRARATCRASAAGRLGRAAAAQPIATALHAAAQVFILADTAYNPLGVDEVAAEHLDADCVVGCADSRHVLHQGVLHYEQRCSPDTRHRAPLSCRAVIASSGPLRPCLSSSCCLTACLLHLPKGDKGQSLRRTTPGACSRAALPMAPPLLSQRHVNCPNPNNQFPACRPIAQDAVDVEAAASELAPAIQTAVDRRRLQAARSPGKQTGSQARKLEFDSWH
jgi:hypothetical protein